MASAADTKEKKEAFNDFYYDGTDYGKGVHYTCFDYVPVSKFTPLSGTNWWRVDRIKGAPVFTENRADITVDCVRCGDACQKQSKVMRIEVISYDKNLFRVRFDPYAQTFSDYDKKENTYGPITRAQLDWIQHQNSSVPKFLYDDKGIEITLKDVILTFDQYCIMTVKSLATGDILHQDGWVTPPGMNEDNRPRGIVFVDQQYGSAVAAIKTLPKDCNGQTPHYYGCGANQNYYDTQDAKHNHTSSLDHSGHVVTFFNYDNYRFNQPELWPIVEKKKDRGLQKEFIPQYVTAPSFIEYARDSSYAYGLLLDNISQSYINLGSRIHTGAVYPENTENIDHVYYFGAQYPELDYYLTFPSLSDQETGLIASVIDNYTILTGREHELGSGLNLRGAMPPKYIFGVFQGMFGFSGLKRGPSSVKSVVDGYKNSNIPLEGLAIDVDIQEDFNMFTTNRDFWESGEVGSGDSVFEWAHKQDLVCQTNITTFIRNDQQDFCVHDTMKDNDLHTKCSRFISYTKEGSAEGKPYTGHLSYANTTAAFPHFSSPRTPEWWGRNYWDIKQVPNALLKIGLDFIWLDMTGPSMSPHLLGNDVEDVHFHYNPPDHKHLTTGIFNWKTYHGQQLYGDPRYAGNTLPFIALRNLHDYMVCKATHDFGLTIDGHYPSYYNRSYIISRGGYVGLAHFGGLWTGDDDSNWKTMQIEMPKILNMGMCGFPIIGSDLGGFTSSRTEKYQHTQEHLMVRWVQASTLLPWFRDHYVNFLRGGKSFQELYKFVWKYKGRKFSDIMNDFVKMRLRFHHVLYSAMYKFCKTGVPPVKASCLYEGGSKNSNVMKGFTSCQDSQYFVGDCAIMVSPALEDENCGALKDHSAKNYPSTIYGHPVWFPANKTWYPYDARNDGPCNPGNGFEYTQGTFGFYRGDGRAHRFTVPLENMPVFIKEGAIIPTRITADGSVKNIQQLDKHKEPFVFDIWPSAEPSSYQCYFDDGGKTRNAELKGEYSLVKLEQRSVGGDVWQITFTSDHMEYQLPKFLYLRLRAAVSGTISDSQNRSYSSCLTLADLFRAWGSAFYYDTAKKEQWIKVLTDNLEDLTVSKKGTSDIHQLSFPDA